MWRRLRPARNRTSLIVAVMRRSAPVRPRSAKNASSSVGWLSDGLLDAEPGLLERVEHRPQVARAVRGGHGQAARADVELRVQALEQPRGGGERAVGGQRDVHAARADLRLQLRRRARGDGHARRSARRSRPRAGRPPRGTAWSARAPRRPAPALRSRPTCRRGSTGPGRSSARRGTRPGGARPGRRRGPAAAASRRCRSRPGGRRRARARSAPAARRSARPPRACASFCSRASSIRFSRPVSRSSSVACWPASEIDSRTAPRLGHDVEAVDERAPAGRRQQRGEDADGGRLPGAVVAEQAEHRARLRRQVEPAQRLGLAVAPAQALGEARGSYSCTS